MWNPTLYRTVIYNEPDPAHGDISHVQGASPFTPHRTYPLVLNIGSNLGYTLAYTYAVAIICTAAPFWKSENCCKNLAHWIDFVCCQAIRLAAEFHKFLMDIYLYIIEMLSRIYMEIFRCDLVIIVFLIGYGAGCTSRY